MIHNVTHSPVTAAHARLCAILFLGLCFVAPNTATADLVNVDSVQDYVQIKHDPIGLNKDSTGKSKAGNTLDVEESGFRSFQFTDVDPTNNFFASWNPEFAGASGALSEPDTLMLARSIVRFTAAKNLDFTATAINNRGTGQANSLVEYTLTDLTTGQQIAYFNDGWQDGAMTNSGNPATTTGILSQDHDFIWETSYRMSNHNADSSSGVVIGSGNGSLEFSNAAIPEPSAIALLGVAGLGLLFRRRRRR